MCSGRSVRYCSRIRSIVSPAARLSNTIETGTRVPSKHAVPCMILGSTLMYFRQSINASLKAALESRYGSDQSNHCHQSTLRSPQPLRLRVGRLRKSDTHRPQRLLAADRQVRDEVELLPALLHVGFQLVMRAPGLLLHDHGDWRVGLSVRAAASHLRQPPLSRCGIVVGMQVEVRYAQQASIATGGVGDAVRPERRMRNDDL